MVVFSLAHCAAAHKRFRSQKASRGLRYASEGTSRLPSRQSRFVLRPRPLSSERPKTAIEIFSVTCGSRCVSAARVSLSPDMREPKEMLMVVSAQGSVDFFVRVEWHVFSHGQGEDALQETHVLEDKCFRPTFVRGCFEHVAVQARQALSSRKLCCFRTASLRFPQEEALFQTTSKQDL